MARLVSGVLLGAGFFALVWFGNASVLLVVALGVGVLAFHEYAELMRALGAVVPRTPSLLALLATIVVVPFRYLDVVTVLGLGLVLLAIAAMAAAARRPVSVETPARPDGGGITGLLAGGFGLMYLGLPLGALVAIHVVGGRGAVVLLVATVAISDTAQYYTGRLLGRHPLAPRLSPKKTIEGALGGFVAAPVFLYFAGPYFVPAAAAETVAPLGLLLVACGIAGDLFESMIKRAANAKDSSALIPGHGGVLDRIDALLFAALPFYAYLQWVYTA